MIKAPKVVLIAAIMLVAIVSLIVLLPTQPPARSPLPNPNGYDDFMNAAGLVTGDPSNASTLDHDSFVALISSNAEALHLLRIGLTRRCVMPMDSSLTNAAGNLNQLAGMKRLVQLLAAEGKLAEMENRSTDAARSYTDAIRFGNEISRGGLLITRLVGIACEAIGCQALARIVPRLNREAAQVVLAELQKVDADRVQWAEILRNERQYHRFLSLNPVLRVMGWWQSRAAMQKAVTKHRIMVAHVRLLAAELALRAYEADRGRVPTRLDELVPNYLAKLPGDPFAGQALIYRPQGATWLLYSIGPDGVDDGGKPAVGRGWPVKGDLFFDSPW
jgi:hypothetical protein